MNRNLYVRNSLLAYIRTRALVALDRCLQVRRIYSLRELLS